MYVYKHLLRSCWHLKGCYNIIIKVMLGMSHKKGINILIHVVMDPQSKELEAKPPKATQDLINILICLGFTSDFCI